MPGWEVTYRTVYDAHYDRTVRLAARRTGSRDAGEDIAQQAWLGLLTVLQKNPEHPKPAAALYQVLDRRIADHFRKVYAAGHPLPIDDPDREDTVADLLSDDGGIPLAVAKADLARAWGVLSDRERWALALRAEGLSERGCADAMGLKIDNLRKILKKARRTLRGALGMDGRQADVTEVRR